MSVQIVNPNTQMGASGANHAPGTVPDPGATAGTTKFLREDATWDVPSGGGGGVTSLNGETGALSLTSTGATITITTPTSTTINLESTGGGGGGYLKGSGTITVGTASPDGNVYSGTATVTGALVGQAVSVVGAALSLANNITTLSGIVTATNTISIGAYFPTNFSALSGGTFIPQVSVLIIVFP